MSQRFILLALAITAVGVSCGNPTPVGPDGGGAEICDNKQDDNGDGKADCADPKCFAETNCVGISELCDNQIDDNNDGKTDCADPYCDGLNCGLDCICRNGQPGKPAGTGGGQGGGSGGGQGGGKGGGAGGGSGGGKGGGAGGGLGGGVGGGTGGHTGGGSGGNTGGGTGGHTGGGSGGGVGGSTGGGSGGSTGGGVGGSTGGGSGGSTGGGVGGSTGGGAGGSTGGGVGGSTGGGSGGSTGGGVGGSTGGGSGGGTGGGTGGSAGGTEICDDLIDNNANLFIDCADPGCQGHAKCSNVLDGLPCVVDTQCAGGRCYPQADGGLPNGLCANAVSCTVGTDVGCHGGRCVTTTSASFNTCRAKCLGNGMDGGLNCRAGYACIDPDTNTTNDNNYCTALCTSDTECAGADGGYGCNPWSKRCDKKDKALGRYGAGCTSGSECESGRCFTGTNWPDGYCTGLCRQDTRNCASGGYCDFSTAWGDNVGWCLQGCNTDSQCRNNSYYWCWTYPSGASTKACLCRVRGESCSYNSDCCSGSCDNGFFFPTYTCN